VTGIPIWNSFIKGKVYWPDAHNINKEIKKPSQELCKAVVGLGKKLGPGDFYAAKTCSFLASCGQEKRATKERVAPV
jgi:hypothetical protein